MSSKEQGWSWPVNSQRAHYFPAGELISLCGRWMILGGEREDDKHDSPDNCAACRKKLDKLRER